jgi:hypothetical protein
VLKVLREQQVLKVLREQQVLKVLRVLRVLREQQEHLVQVVLQELQV